MDFENINVKIGGCGLYQYIVFLLLSITTFKYAGDFQGVTFSLHRPNFTCVPNNYSFHTNSSLFFIAQDQCSYKTSKDGTSISCSTWVYDQQELSNSLVTEFNMVCSQAYYKDYMFIVYFTGSFSSYPVLLLADTVGRYHLLLVSTYLSVIITICQVFAAYLWQHFILTFISGTLKSVYIALAFTTLIELMPIKKLDLAATNFWILYGIGYMGSALSSYIGKSWRAVVGSSLVLTVFYLLYICFIPETPRWLMLNQKRDKCFKTISFIARINRRTLEKIEFDKWQPVPQKTGKFWNLFKSRTMICRLLILNFAAWSFNFAYLGSATDLTFASKNIFITTFFMGLIELPTGPLAGFLANKLGRKKSVISLSILGIVCLITMPFIESDIAKSSWQPWLKTVIAMGAKLGFTSAWLVFDVISSETMPTSVRNASMATIYVVVGLGSIVAPMIHEKVTNWYPALPCLVYSVFLTGTVFLVWFFIPETHNLPIPQTIEQAMSLVIHKEQEWKEKMIQEAKILGITEETNEEIELQN